MWFEAPTKSPPDVRPPIEKCATKGIKSLYATIGDSDTQRIADVASAMVKAGAFADGEGLSLACGAGFSLHMMLYPQSGAAEPADTAGAFSALVELHGKVVPSLLAAEWWIETCAAVDVTSARLAGSTIGLVPARNVA